MSKRKNILPQMFDVKPVNADGSLNLEKIKNSRRTVVFSKKNVYFRKSGLRLSDIVRQKNISYKPSHQAYPENTVFSLPSSNHQQKINIRKIKLYSDKTASSFYPLQKEARIENFRSEPEPLDRFFQAPIESPPHEIEYQPKIKQEAQAFLERIAKPDEKLPKKRKKTWKLAFKKKKKSLHLFLGKLTPNLSKLKIQNNTFSQRKLPIPRFSYAVSFAAILLLFSGSIPAFSYIQRALNMKTTLVSSADMALGQLAEAKDNLSNSQFDKASVDFSDSYQILSDASKDIDKIGGNFSDILRFIPGISRVASANYVVSAGEHFSLAGKSLAESAKSLNSLGNPLDTTNQTNQPSLTDLFLNLRDGMQKSSDELTLAQDDLSKVNVDDLPAETRSQFTDIKDSLPIVNASLKNFLDYSQIFLDVLGYNGPRKYLFLFENNQEMRATGGFIGSYGILDISSGRVKKLFVDDIYNPDGQLKAKVIPPAPIQKMSAVWTMHDANWFPDFPTSAEKVAWFYEKTGGPTVDGVIAITPELLQDLLENYRTD